MPLILTRPVLKDGTGLSWGTNPIDAKMISDNWQTIYSGINSGLHHVNLDKSALDPGDKLDSGCIQYPEYHSQMDVLPQGVAPGATHSHNGIDSAFLAQGAVINTAPVGFGKDCTQYRSFGAFMHPSLTHQLYLTSTTMDIRNIAGGGSEDFYGELPVDSVQWDMHLLGQTHAYLRCFPTLRIDDNNLKDQVKAVSVTGSMEYISAHTYQTFKVRVQVVYNSTLDAMAVDGFYIHVAALLYVGEDA